MRRKRLLKKAPNKQDGPERRCIATGVIGDPEVLFRFVLDPNGVVTPDPERKLPGRGAWVTATRSAVEQAISRKAFARTFKRDVTVEPALADDIAALLRRRALNALGLARRVGEAATGFDLVKKALAKGNVAVLVLASDGGKEGKRKLKAQARGVELVETFTVVELAEALGKENVVSVAIKSGAAAERLLRAARRFEAYSAEAEIADSK